MMITSKMMRQPMDLNGDVKGIEAWCQETMENDCDHKASWKEHWLSILPALITSTLEARARVCVGRSTQWFIHCALLQQTRLWCWSPRWSMGHQWSLPSHPKVGSKLHATINEYRFSTGVGEISCSQLNIIQGNGMRKLRISLVEQLRLIEKQH